MGKLRPMEARELGIWTAPSVCRVCCDANPDILTSEPSCAVLLSLVVTQVPLPEPVRQDWWEGKLEPCFKKKKTWLHIRNLFNLWSSNFPCLWNLLGKKIAFWYLLAVKVWLVLLTIYTEKLWVQRWFLFPQYHMKNLGATQMFNDHQ